MAQEVVPSILYQRWYMEINTPCHWCLTMYIHRILIYTIIVHKVINLAQRKYIILTYKIWHQMYNCPTKHAHYNYLLLQELTHVCSLCLHCTPISSSHSRHRSHSDIVLNASCQWHNGRSLRRIDNVLTAPGCSPMFPVLKMVLRNRLITLRVGPGCP